MTPTVKIIVVKKFKSSIKLSNVRFEQMSRV